MKKREKTEKLDVRLYGVGDYIRDPFQSGVLKSVTITVKRVGDSWIRQGGPSEFRWENRTDRDITATTVRVQTPRAYRIISEEVMLGDQKPSMKIEARKFDEKTKKWNYNFVSVTIPEKVVVISRDVEASIDESLR